MRTFTQQPRESRQNTPASVDRRNLASREQVRETSPLLQLQRRVGNQGVQRMLQAQAEAPQPATSLLRPSHLAHSSPTGALTVSQPHDAHEQEAEHVAAQVMRMQAPPPGDASHVHTHGRAPGGADGMHAPAIVQQALLTPGQPLDAQTRAFFEPRFGHDLGQVRVHTGETAQRSADAIEAEAYTAGADIVFARGRYAPETSEGRHLLAHELTHTIQQGAAASVQRQPKQKAAKPPADALLKSLKALVASKTSDYVAYKKAITDANAEQRKVALADTALLAEMKPLLAGLSFPRCVEALGRRAPTFDELRKTGVVKTALEEAWKASDVGVKDAVTQAHEEGGWVFMNLIDGSLSIQRAKATGTNYIEIEPFPELENSIVVATFHTHPTPSKTPGPSNHDKQHDKRRGVPNLVAAAKKSRPKDFDVFLSGPPARKHLASDTRIPGPSGGIAP